MNDMMPSYTRQAKNEAEQQKEQDARLKKLAKINKKLAKKIEPAPVKVFTKKAIKELNRKLKKTGEISPEDYEEVK